MKIVTFVKDGKRVDMPYDEFVKAWYGDPEGHAEARRHAQEIKALPEDRKKDYYEHKKAGTPHEFAIGLAERASQ